MLKKFKLLFSLLLLILSFIVGVSKVSGDSGKGHWIYDRYGNHAGCVSPGSDCKWGGPLVK